jgi:hypothetical protein
MRAEAVGDLIAIFGGAPYLPADRSVAWTATATRRRRIVNADPARVSAPLAAHSLIKNLHFSSSNFSFQFFILRLHREGRPVRHGRRHWPSSDVCFWGKADIANSLRHVRF